MPALSEVLSQVPEGLAVPDFLEAPAHQAPERTLFVEVQETGADSSLPVDGGTVPKVFAGVFGNAYWLLVFLGVLR